jgi:amidophosphoribosyltransferase
LYEYGAKDIHIRISCPPLLHPCPFLNFSSSKGPLELIARRFIESKEGAHDRNLDRYATPGTPEYNSLVEHIREELKVATLEFNTVEHIVEAIGLPKCSICTHCFDGSSYGHE